MKKNTTTVSPFLHVIHFALPYLFLHEWIPNKYSPIDPVWAMDFYQSLIAFEMVDVICFNACPINNNNKRGRGE